MQCSKFCHHARQAGFRCRAGASSEPSRLDYTRFGEPRVLPPLLDKRSSFPCRDRRPRRSATKDNLRTNGASKALSSHRCEPQNSLCAFSWLLLGACQEVTPKHRYRSARGVTAQKDRQKAQLLKNYFPNQKGCCKPTAFYPSHFRYNLPITRPAQRISEKSDSGMGA